MSRLLPYETIIQATNGEPEAVNAVLAHYAGYIRYYQIMYPDGICYLGNRRYSQSIEFFDINYLLAQPDDQTAIVIPVILLYAITFAFDSVPLLLPYDIRIIIQPRSANAITEIVTKQDFEITFCAWIVADSFLTLIGLARNKDIL